MTRKLLDPLPKHVTEPQRRASDPASSAWVRANAGSGKTHVLTERVMRLLLAGVAPEEILCLTYTKAAAAEMRRRVSSRLADWALLPEPALVERLAAMEGRTPGAAMLARVFDMFTQVDYSLERSNAGLGVGLTLARRLVELHDGKLEAFSEGPDKGSSFVATLPLAVAAAPPARGRTAPEDLPERHFRILLADDNVDFSSSLATLLRSLGHELLVAEDGLRALEAAPSFQPDFAFLDIGLPGLNGYALARALRANPATSDTVLVAITGWGQERDRQLAMEAGFDHHLVKPVEPAKIREVLAREWRPA